MFGFGKKKNGIETELYDNGQIKSEITYLEGTKLRIAMWHENGQKALEGEYFGGHEFGTWTTWHDNGAKSGEIEYDVLGRQEGNSTSWYENGKIISYNAATALFVSV